MGSPFRMLPGKGTTARTTGSGFALRGLVNPPAPLHTHEGGKKHVPKSETLSKVSPSKDVYSTEVKNTPGSSKTSKITSSSGSLSTTNYDDAIKAEGTKILPKGQKSTPEMTAKYNAARKAAKDKDKANKISNASSATKTEIIEPSRKVEDKKRNISSGRVSAADQQKKLENISKNIKSEVDMKKEIAMNEYAKDSAKVRNDYVKSRPIKIRNSEKVKTEGARRGNVAATSLNKYGGNQLIPVHTYDKISGKVKKSTTQFTNKKIEGGTHTDEEMAAAFNTNYGNRTFTSGDKGYKTKKTKMKANVTNQGYGNQTNVAPGSPADKPIVKKGTKKGQGTYSSMDSRVGSRGARE